MEKFREKIEVEKEAEIQSPEFEIEEFEKARENFESLIKELTPAIRNHEYNVVVGDDASGRIPARVISGLMKEVYEEDEVHLPKIKFLAGGRHRRLTEEFGNKLDDYFYKLVSEKKIKPQDKILLVTEHMDSGTSEAQIIRTVKKAGLDCDIAALACWRNPVFYRNSLPRSAFGGVKIYSGGNDLNDLYFWNKPFISGVEKREGEIFSNRREGDRKGILAARRDVKKMVNYLKQIYDREKEKIEE